MTSANPPSAPGQPKESSVRAGRVAWELLGYAVLWVGLALWYGTGSHQPSVQARDAPAEAFSAERAEDLLRGWMPRPEPHPVGSPAAETLRERMAESLRELGGVVEVQTSWAAAAHDPAVLGRVHNLVAHFPAPSGNGWSRVGAGGQELSSAGIEATDQAPDHAPGQAPKDLLLCAHYDSVAAGPGEHDDLIGCAVWVEAVRAHLALHGPNRRLGLWVLFTEGEEAGLLGAQAFVREHPALDRIGLVANLEARGAAGPSRLFEMGLGNGPWVRAFAEEAPFPSATSLSVEVYRRMPNGSDLSVFLEHGVPGMNFAYIGDWAAYHSPLDSLDRGPEATRLISVQHHGENGMAVLRAMEARGGVPAWGARTADSQPGAQPFQDRGHFDFLGRALWTWPFGLQWVAALAALACLLWGAGRWVAGPSAWRAWAGGVALHVAWVALPVAIAALWLWPLRGWAGTDRPFWSRHLPGAILALGAWWMTAAVLLRPSRRLPERWHVRAMLLLYTGLALASTALVPGAGFLFVPVALGLGLVALLPDRWQGRGATWLAGLSLFAWYPLHLGLLDAFGWDSPVALLIPQSLPLAMCVPSLLRFLPQRGWAFGTLGVLCLVFTAVVTATREPFTIDRPATLNLVVTEEGDERDVQVQHGRFRDVSLPDREGLQAAAQTRDPESSEGSAPSRMVIEPLERESWWRVRWQPGHGSTRAIWRFEAPGPTRVRLGEREFEATGDEWVLLGVPPQGLQWDWYAPGLSTHGIQAFDEVDGLPQPMQAWLDQGPDLWVPRGRGHRWRRAAEVSVRSVDEPPTSGESKAGD